MGQRILFSFLSILAVLAAISLDVLVSRALLDPESIDRATRVGALVGDLADSVATTALGPLLARGSVVPLVFLVLVVGGAWEMDRMFRSCEVRPHTCFAVLMIALLQLSPWLSAGGWLGRSPASREGLQWQLVWMAASTVGTGILAVLRRSPTGTLRNVGATWMMVLYLGLLPSFATQLRCSVQVPGYEGAWLLLVVLLVTKSTDIGAFVVGTAIGRHRLVPSISPSKSIEGMLGGILVSMGVAVGIAAAGGSDWLARQDAAPLVFLSECTSTFSREVPGGLHPLLRSAILGLALSAVAQFGDLLESCFKRDAGMKDSGRVVPRLGGILDLIDSPVLAVPVAWFLLTAVWRIV
jgi:phosphatidate cytidylyltransferase